MSFVQVLMYVIPMAFLAALSPTNITLVILMLMNKKYPVARARAFELGFMTSLVVVGTIAFTVFSSIETPPIRSGTYLIIATLGVVMVILGIRQFVLSIDPDEPPKHWMDRMTEFRPLAAFWIGVAVSAFGLKSLGIFAATLGIILTAGIGPLLSLLSIVIVILVMCSTMWIPILVYRLNQEGAADLMERTYAWMQRQKKRISGSVLLLVGGLMVWIGLQGVL